MPDLTDCTVLLVDDTPENMDILVEALGDVVDVTVALDGETALETIAAEKPDLILLDIEMPGMDGFEVCRRLKHDPETSGIPVIFLSARTDETSRRQGLDLGALDFITKPFVTHDVVVTVREALAPKNCAEHG